MATIQVWLLHEPPGKYVYNCFEAYKHSNKAIRQVKLVMYYTVYDKILLTVNPKNSKLSIL